MKNLSLRGMCGGGERNRERERYRERKRGNKNSGQTKYLEICFLKLCH